MVYRWFRQSRYTSFQRQLNMYRFTRIANGPDKNGYHHPYFLRGREDLTRHILRLPRDATGLPRTDRVMVDPNFYTMSPVTKHTVVTLPNSSSVASNNNEDTFQAGLALPSLPPRNQHPLRSTTTNQANPALIDIFVSPRTNPFLPNNSIVNLDLASRFLPPTISTTDPFQSARINSMALNTTHNSSNLLSTYMPPGGVRAINPTTSTDSSILERLLLSSALNLNPAITAALNPMPVLPNNSIVSLDLASRYLPPMLSTTDPFHSARINPMALNTTHNSSNLLSTYVPPGGAAAINPTANTHSPILDRLLLSSAMNPYPDVAISVAVAAAVLNPMIQPYHPLVPNIAPVPPIHVLNPMIQPHHPLVPNIAPDPPIYDWTTAANLMLSQPRMPTEYNPMLVLPPQQQQQPTLDLTTIDRVTLARWIEHQQEQELALALLQQRRQP
jgi:hypothetical protein